MEIWNMKDLAPPPVSSCKTSLKEIDVRLLHIMLKDGVNFFENQQHLYTEAALLSRIIYRFKLKFRSSKDFKAVERLNRILRSYLSINMPQLLKTLLNSVPQNYKVNETYILTKNMVDYVLVRLQGLGKILCKILEASTLVSHLSHQRIRLGHFWNIALIIHAIAARIFVITKSILKYACELYSNLLPFSSSLCNSGVQWLSEGYIFPTCLDEWLDVNWLDLERIVIEIVDDDPEFSYFNLIDDSEEEVEISDEYVLIRDDPFDPFENQMGDRTSPHTIENITIDESDDVNGLSSDEIINVSDNGNNHSPTSLKRKRVEIDFSNNYGSSSELDVGEVIDLSESINLTPQNKKRHKRNKRNPSQNNVSTCKMNKVNKANAKNKPKKKRKKKNSTL